MRLRFAPSPTGNLHVGNLRTALLNKLHCQKHNACFILRLDDTDAQRSTEEFANNIMEDLQWLNLSWQETYKQSERIARYEEVFSQFLEQGLLYPCYETPEELEYKRRRQMTLGKPPVYDRSALQLTKEDVDKLEAEGRKPHFRFKLPNKTIQFNDIVKGEQSFGAGHISDPVVRRNDGSFLYMLPSVIDDFDMKITHVLRGEDHISNTAVQIPMFEALGAQIPMFAHLPLMVDADGGKLSKRLGSLSISDLKKQGIEPIAISNYLANLGSSVDLKIDNLTIAELAADFALENYAKNKPRFNEEQLWAANTHVLQKYSYDNIASRIAHLDNANESFWETIKYNLNKFDEIFDWYSIIFDNKNFKDMIDEHDFLNIAKDLLPQEDLDKTSWKTWTDSIKSETGRKGKELFMPLRIALTGQHKGPEMKDILPLIGRQRIIERLS